MVNTSPKLMGWLLYFFQILSEYSVHFTNDTIQLLNLKEFMNKDNMQDLETETEPKVRCRFSLLNGIIIGSRFKFSPF